MAIYQVFGSKFSKRVVLSTVGNWDRQSTGWTFQESLVRQILTMNGDRALGQVDARPGGGPQRGQIGWSLLSRDLAGRRHSDGKLHASVGSRLGAGDF